VQMLVDEGRISAEEASSHPQRSLLTRALDGRDIDPEYSVRQVLPGDRYLICSDGLSGVVSAETIGDSLREYTDPQQCVERLVALALRGGGPDNITVVIADATDQDILEAAPIVGGAAARDRGMATTADDTPASRASAALAPPRAATPEPAPSNHANGRDDEPERSRRHPVRTAILLSVLLVALSGGLWAGWTWTQKQFYVGATEQGQLAVFRGVPGEIAGLDLSSVRSTSSTSLNDLTMVAQERVKQGIQADDEPDAQRRLAELTHDDPTNPNLKPSCLLPSPSVTPSAPASPSGLPSATGSASAAVSSTPSGIPTGTPPASIPATTPDAPPSDQVPPVIDPADCRPSD
jgi:PPM family protein phosphatase